MKNVVTAAEMAALDSKTINNIGVPGAALMERAALAVAQYVRENCRGPALVACGPGNNGGDGLAVARMLRLWGWSVFCYVPEAAYRGVTLMQYKAAVGCGVLVLHSQETFSEEIRRVNVIVDALFGTGLSRDLVGPWAEAIRLINGASAQVVAVDIPSGIDGTTGHIRGAAVRADATVTFQYAKTGHYLYPGREYAGKLLVADIGILDDSTLRGKRRILEKDDAVYPTRRANSHKGDYGHVAVIAGSLGMLGAGSLCARAAVRGGAGLVTWCVPGSLAQAASALTVEAMIQPIPDEEGHFALCSRETLLQAINGKNSVVLGPGLSRNAGTSALVRNILKDIDIPMVVDADALFGISGQEDVRLRSDCVLTPHPGEMARLLGCSVAEVEANPMGAVRSCAKRFGCTALLKGSTTLIDRGDEVTFNLTGNAGMATGGAGDVLAGLIASLEAQGVGPYEAAARACYLHGWAGDIAARRSQPCLIAGDIIDCLPEAAGGAEAC